MLVRYVCTFIYIQSLQSNLYHLAQLKSKKLVKNPKRRKFQSFQIAASLPYPLPVLPDQPVLACQFSLRLTSIHSVLGSMSTKVPHTYLIHPTPTFFLLPPALLSLILTLITLIPIFNHALARISFPCWNRCNLLGNCCAESRQMAPNRIPILAFICFYLSPDKLEVSNSFICILRCISSHV